MKSYGEDTSTASGTKKMGRVSSIAIKSLAAMIVAAIATYGGLTLVPPPATPMMLPAWDASVCERIFPGVPCLWVLLRLACMGFVFLAATLIATRQPFDVPANDAPVAAWTPLSPLSIKLAFACALAHVLVLPWAAELTRHGQLAYIAWLFVPPIILFMAGVRRPPARSQTRTATPWLALLLICVLWLLLRLPTSVFSPLVASGVDSDLPFEYLANTLDAHFNLLTDHQNVGVTALLSVFQGPAILGITPAELTPQLMQRVQIFWTACTALLLGWLANAFAGRRSAPIAAAAFLFSPFTTATTLLLGGLFLGPLLTAALLATLVCAARDARLWAVPACAAVGGIMLTHPGIAPIGALGFGMLLLLWWHRPFPLLTLATATLSFAAAVLPGLPRWDAIQNMSSTYATARQSWVAMESVGFGLVPPSFAEFNLHVATSGPLDSIVGAILSPWATPRTPMRLWGDAIFEPVGAGLFALGLGVLLARARRCQFARCALLLVALAVLPAFVSSYDRSSLTRAFALPLLVALVAGFGHAWLERLVSLPYRRFIATALVATVIAGGTYLFDHVQPRILARSGLSTALAATQSATQECLPAALIVSAPQEERAHRPFVSALSSCPLELVTLGANATAVWSPLDDGGLVYWTPGLEDELGVGARICSAHPHVRIWALSDESGFVPVFIAAGPESSWRPPEWAKSSRHSCAETLPTIDARARLALADAHSLRTGGDIEGAVRTLRTAAQSTFVHADLYMELARTLELSPVGVGEIDEAAYWAWRAAASRRFRDIAAVELAARLNLMRGDVARATAILRIGVDDARARGDLAGTAVLESLLSGGAESPVGNLTPAPQPDYGRVQEDR